MNSLANDLDYVLQHTAALWDNLRDKRIFITGGTGFFGCWLLESFLWANKRLNLNASAVILTRNTAAFRSKYPHLVGQSALQFIEGDVRDFNYPSGDFSYLIHAATEASVSLNKDNPDLMRDTIVRGTQHTLNFATQCGQPRVLFTSSGAVYGVQPAHMPRVPEHHTPIAEDLERLDSAYAEGKRQAERLCAQYAQQYNLPITIARCFAFVGPYLPLNQHFAIANFIRDGLHGNCIQLQSDGLSYRSYLYAADLAIWLWTILFNGKTMHPYNVGSDQAIRIKDLAQLVGDSFQPAVPLSIQSASSSEKPNRYVPDISRAKKELKLEPLINLTQAIQSTKAWHLSNNPSSESC